jgi:imidazolonepropionase-like amidohydrolase
MSARVVFAALALLGAGVPISAETIAIVGATVHTMTQDDPITNATVVVRDGRIDAVGTNVSAPAGARVIDGKGRIVTPAFMNSATQLGLTEVSAVAATNDVAVSDGELGAAFDVQYAINPRSLLIRQAQVDGLSRAITFPSGSAGAPFAGLGALLHVLANDSLVERTRIAMFADVGGESSSAAGGSRSAQWLLIRNALDEARARRLSAKSSPRDSFLSRLDLAALKPVADGTVPLVIDANRESDIRQAIALARDYGIPVVVKGAVEAWRAAEELAAAQVPVVLDPSINMPLYFDHVGARADNAALLQKAGVRMAFNVSSIHTSFNAGFALRDVAGLAVANGLPHHAALAALTVNPAKIWRIDDRYGTITAGREAEILVWDGDPFEPMSTLVTVLAQGREIDLTTRQTLLRDRYKPGPKQALPPAYRRPQ